MTPHRAPSPVTNAEATDVSCNALLTASGPQRSDAERRAPTALPWEGLAPPTAAGAEPTAAHALRPSPESVKEGRDFAKSALRQWGLTALADLAALVVSELVTNAVRHGVPSAPGPLPDRPIRLRLLAQAPFVMCMVADPGAGIPVRRESGPFAESGHGLTVVDSCSVRWGWHLLDEGGKVVWALLRPHG